MRENIAAPSLSYAKSSVSSPLLVTTALRLRPGRTLPREPLAMTRSKEDGALIKAELNASPDQSQAPSWLQSYFKKRRRTKNK